MNAPVRAADGQTARRFNETAVTLCGRELAHNDFRRMHHDHGRSHHDLRMVFVSCVFTLAARWNNTSGGGEEGGNGG